MRVPILLLVTLVAGIPTETAQVDKPPPNEPPQLWQASASEQEGKVIIQIARPDYVEPRQAVAAEAMRWRNLKQVTLGETVRAFGVDGKRMEPKAVLKALAKARGVAVFVRYQQPLLDPDPYYLAMLRDGTVALVVGAGDILDPIPMP
jgi:hypothetical protein